MGEPWEFDEAEPVARPEKRAPLAWFNNYSVNAQIGMFSLGYVLIMLAGLFLFVAVWRDEWTVVLSRAIEPIAAQRPLLLVLAVISVTLASLLIFLRGLFKAGLPHIWVELGGYFGLIVGGITFLFAWGHAIYSWGWLLGIAFGWLPALFIGFIAGFVAWGLAPVIAIAAALALFWVSAIR